MSSPLRNTSSKVITTAPVAPWRSALEATINANLPDDPQNLFYVSLATIKPFGRPANRTIFFRGFLTDSTTPYHATETDLPDQSDSGYFMNMPTPMERSASPEQTVEIDPTEEFPTLAAENKQNPVESPSVDTAKQASENALNNVVVFVTDVRSGNVEDLIHGSRFGEVCWFFPHTKEQFRLSGTLHLVVSPDHALVTTHKVGYPVFTLPPSPGYPSTTTVFPIDWEQKRLEIWRHLSSVRRASFTWPKPGAPCAETSQTSPMLTKLSANHTERDHPTRSSEPGECHHEPQQEQHQHQLHHRHTSPHSHALSNFCLLLLEVDGADHLRLGDIPHVRVKYRKSTGTDVLEHAVHFRNQMGWTTSAPTADHEDPLPDKHSVLPSVAASNMWSVNAVNP